jgi:hypothetical protein
MNISKSDVLRAAAIPIIDTGDGRAVAVFSSKTIVLSHSERQIVGICRDLDTWDRHISSVSNQLHLEPTSAYESLEALVKCGILVSSVVPANSFNARFGTNKLLNHISIFTHHRPDALKECIDSNVANLLRYSHRETHIRVWDDSVEPQLASATEQTVQAIAKSSLVPISYVNPQAREIFCEQLATRGVSEDVCRYALLPRSGCRSIGANRNAALLEDIDLLCLFLDDDTSALSALHSDSSRDMLVGGHEDPREFRLFASRREMIDSLSWADIDIIDQHQRLLGKSVKECINNDRQNVIFRNTCAHGLISAGPDSDPNIVLTMPGKAGDCGRSSSAWLVGALARANGSFGEFEERLASEKLPREILEVSKNTAIVHGIGCMATVLGIDGSASLPPFTPHFRNQDGVFGLLLRHTIPHALVGLPNYAAFHNADERRCYGPKHDVGFADLIICIVNACPKILPSAAADLKSLGHWILEVGSQSTEDLQHMLGHWLTNYYLQPLRQFQSQLSRHGVHPPRISEFLSCQYDNLFSLATNRDSHLPTEFRQNGNGAWDDVRKELRQFGELLICWRDIVEATRDLHKKEIYFSKPIMS